MPRISSVLCFFNSKYCFIRVFPEQAHLITVKNLQDIHVVADHFWYSSLLGLLASVTGGS
jgi:hypothetical protein